MIIPPKKPISRRTALQILGQTSIAVPLLGGVTALYPRAGYAQSGAPHRILQIFLNGGWDSILSTDPVIDGTAKASSGNFAPQYYQTNHSSYVGNTETVVGKSNLIVGAGMVNAKNAFAQIPTAFVNGMFVEVTAHELAVNYLYSGKLSLSRSREFPAFIATAANKTGGFPAHIILGGQMPLGDTRATNPPLQSLDSEVFVKMLAGPHSSEYKQATIDAGHTLVAKLNAAYQKRLSLNAKTSLTSWNTSEAGLSSLYAKRFDQKLAITTQMHTDFATGDDAGSIGSKIAMAFLSLREGVSRYVTVNFAGFDTHMNHITTHKPLMAEFATRLNTLINYMTTTNDPDDATKKLAETTTILVYSEFNRTPHFNGAGGTDHWQTGSAIVMGKGVRDNTVIGSTDNQGNANDYGSDKLLPDHLAASFLRKMGLTAEADDLSEVHLNALFT
jgi:hypothetical protein